MVRQSGTFVLSVSGHSDSAQCSAVLYRTHIMDGKDM